MNIKHAIIKAKFKLKNSTSSQLDAELLLSFVLKKPRIYLILYPNLKLQKEDKKNFFKLVYKRSIGIPIPYLTRYKEFWSFPLYLHKGIFIPRSETEQLVELTLSFFKYNENILVLDLGTGSGAIAIAIALERPLWKIIACDINKTAIKIAKINAYNANVKNIRFYSSYWLSNINIKNKFDIIVTNPPYVSKFYYNLYNFELKYEPKTALFGGNNGLKCINIIVKQSYKKLKNGGLLLIEHGFNQKKEVCKILNQHGFTNVRSWKDYQGYNRVCCGKKEYKNYVNNI